MQAWALIGGVLACVLLLYAARYPRAQLEPFLRRPCQGRAWHQAFPRTESAEVRAFLRVFAEAFGFAKHQRLKFRPDDAVLAIYRARYPQRWMPDGMELERFQHLLGRKYGLSLADVWTEHVTLGEIFGSIRARRHAA